MDFNRPIKVNRRQNKSMIWQVMALIAAAVVLSLVIALAWQKISGDSEKSESLPASSVASQPESLPEVVFQPASSETVSSQPEEAPVVLGGAVPESERVKSPYFDNAVFVGDSITTGIELYQMMANTTVLAGTGINLDTIYTSEVVKQEDGTRITIMDGLKKKQYQKLYLMLGGNEVRGDSLEVFIARYGKVLEDIKALQPEAIFYVQSMLPVTAKNKYSLDNTRIDQFNEALMALCKEKNVYYLNVAECMKDENGMLPDAASPADGMHFGPDYYTKWFEYLKKHTVA